LGETIYKHLCSETVTADQLLSMVDLSTEHSQLEVANRLETAILVWRRKIQSKLSSAAAKSSWGMMKELVADENKREQIADKAESMLLSLKLKFPGLPQTALDMNKIQYNKVRVSPFSPSLMLPYLSKTGLLKVQKFKSANILTCRI
jgi:hypothetical protein